MNREDIIRMAREAGFQCLLPSEHTAATGCIYDSGDDEITPLLERFAALVASAEREACALRAEEFLTEPEPDWDGDFWNQAIERVALAIRSRGQA